MSQLRTTLIVGVLLSSVMACGGDDDDDNKTPDKTPVLRDAAVEDGSIGPSREGDEGWPCKAKSDCLPDFKCVDNIFTIGVCARGCDGAAECKTGEACFTYTDDASKHCVNLVTDEYEVCGVGDTSLCQGRSCLYFPMLPIGVCVDICSLDGSGGSGADAGVADAGTGIGPNGVVASCRADETCVDGVIADPQAKEGVCGTVVARGEACGIERGLYCGLKDLCGLSDPNNQDSELRCFQDCSKGNACDTGKCTSIGNTAAYCL